jgi:hypothetical protein
MLFGVNQIHIAFLSVRVLQMITELVLEQLSTHYQLELRLLPNGLRELWVAFLFKDSLEMC